MFTLAPRAVSGRHTVQHPFLFSWTRARNPVALLLFVMYHTLIFSRVCVYCTLPPSLSFLLFSFSFPSSRMTSLTPFPLLIVFIICSLLNIVSVYFLVYICVFILLPLSFHHHSPFFPLERLHLLWTSLCHFFPFNFLYQAVCTSSSPLFLLSLHIFLSVCFFFFFFSLFVEFSFSSILPQHRERVF